MIEMLFPPNPSKTVTAYDIYGKKYRKNLKSFQFRISGYGILIENGSLLVESYPGMKVFGLPGGGIKIDESVEEGVIREFREETGLNVKIEKLFSVTENYFTWDNDNAHAVLITYLVSKTGGTLLAEGNQEDTGEVKFLKLSELNENNMLKVFWPIIRKLK